MYDVQELIYTVEENNIQIIMAGNSFGIEDASQVAVKPISLSRSIRESRCDRPTNSWGLRVFVFSQSGHTESTLQKVVIVSGVVVSTKVSYSFASLNPRACHILT